MTIKKLFLLIISIFSVSVALSQTPGENKKTHGIKLGTFFQNDFYYRYDYYDFEYYTGYRRTEPGGYFYVAYEYEVEYPNKKVISIEPKLGLMLMEQQTGFFGGNDIKFFWVNTGLYRFGASAFVGYRSIHFDQSETLRMENGMYSQLFVFETQLQHIDMDLSLIPFQFQFPKSHINLESHFGFGFSWRIEKPAGDDLSEEVKQQLDETSFHPYFPKLGIKVGYSF